MERHEPVSGWEYERELGTGDFAEVRLVRRNGQAGAMKLATSANQSAIERMRFEIEALRELDHPAIPKLIEDGSDHAPPYFVMTLAKGRSALALIDTWGQRGRVLGSVEVLHLLIQLLDALRHMQDKERVHRDIKDANVIIDIENLAISLIDFGFCKRAGSSGIRDKDSFWRAGAARFSPPRKLDDPALAVASHDVFAVGVLAYRLLSGHFPWSVSTSDGLQAYKKHVRQNPLVMLHEISSLVPLDLSRLVARMLQLNDEDRILTTEALDEAQRLIVVLQDTAFKPIATLRERSYPHAIRDALRGDIRVTQEEYDIINSAEVQRLRWIRQLGFTNLVYPSADHSRLSHSIGTLERVEQALSTIEKKNGARIDADLRREARMYALVHDVTHIALGHTIEDQLGFFDRHDDNSGRFERLVAAETSEVGGILRRTEVGRSVLDRLNPDQDESDDAVESLVSGVVGADVLDYLDRDAFHCGLDMRVDTAIFRQLNLYSKDSVAERKLVSSQSGKYGVRVDHEFAVSTILNDRYAMYLKVYAHSAKIAADVVLGKALADIAGNRPLREPEYEWLGDEALLVAMSRSRKTLSQEMVDRLRKRRLPRGVFRGRLMPDNDGLNAQAYGDTLAWVQRIGADTYRGRQKLERDLARTIGIPVERIFLYLPPKAPGYRLAQMWQQASVLDRPSRRQAGDASISRNHLALWEAWVFLADGTESERYAVAAAAEELFQRANIIEEYRRSLL